MANGEMGRLLCFEGPELEWVVVRTKSHRELRASAHLRQRSVEPYCPMIVRPPWHARAPRGPVPMFTGYLFVHCCPDRHLSAVAFCPGVLRPVVFDHELATVDDSVILALRAREGERGYALPDEMTPAGIPMGCRVRVMTGPLSGLEGVFNGYLRGRERSQVLLSFLRARRPVEVATDAVAMIRA